MQTYRILYRFLAIFALFHVLISAIFILSVTQSIRHSQYRSIRSGLETKARLLCEHVEDVGEVDRTRFREFFSRIRGSLSYRFVIVSSDGKLIADSNEPEAESTFLAGSATLAQAEANGIAFEQREEPRLRQPMLSCVMKYSIGDDEATKGLVCVSTMVGETESLIRQVWWWSVGFASAIGAAFCLLMTLFVPPCCALCTSFQNQHGGLVRAPSVVSFRFEIETTNGENWERRFGRCRPNYPHEKASSTRATNE